MERIQRLRKKLKEKKLDGFILESKANRYYLTGLDSTAGWVLITSKEAFLLVDSRYILAAKKLNNSLAVIEVNYFKDFWKQFCTKNLGLKIGFESSLLSHREFSSLKNPKVKLVPVLHLIEELREVKDQEEIKLLKKSLKIAEEAFEHILGFIKIGLTEKEVAWELEKFMRERGAQEAAWQPFIVASGVHSGEPHHHPGNKKIKKGELLQLDFGCKVGGYHCDISRVVFMGKPTPEQERVYELVLEAQELGKSLIKPGVIMGEVDRKVREFLHQNTLAGHVYRHSLGHGLGLEIHEPPTIYSGSEEKFVENQVVTVEPGLYIEDWGGVRLEDQVLVTKSGSVTWNKSSKNLNRLQI